jgi:hypothetical protein
MGQRNSIRSDLLPEYQQLNSQKKWFSKLAVNHARRRRWSRRCDGLLRKSGAGAGRLSSIPEHSYSLECVSDSKRAILCHFAGPQIRQKIDAMRFENGEDGLVL